MKLSSAIILGDTLKKCEPRKWISDDGSCGCAFGGALLAAGMTVEQFQPTNSSCNAIAEMPFVRNLWPWITGDHVLAISNLYDQVAEGEKTIEDVAAYVASVEPPDEPDYQGDQGDEQPVRLSSDYETGLEMEHNRFGYR